MTKVWKILASALILTAGLGRPVPFAAAQDVERGAELFAHEWQVGDPLSAAGDGLGPLYNAKSCAACHRLAGVGGAGPNENNVDLVARTPAKSPNDAGLIDFQQQFKDLVGNQNRPSNKSKSATRPKSAADRLGLLHPALGSGRDAAGTTILHRHGVDDAYDFRRYRLLGLNVPLNPTDKDRPRLEDALAKRDRRSNTTREYSVAGVSVTLAFRQTPSLFGAGLIDAIPDPALWNMANSQVGNERGISGRVAVGQPERLNPYGRADFRVNPARPVVGKFGWRGQTGSLRQFVLNACANELGLEVPSRSQPVDPRHPGFVAPGLDLRADDCEALVAYVASLPPPTRKLPTEPHDLERVQDGERIFARVGCADCHQPSMVTVDGLYSDLLLHDLGQDLADPIAAASALAGMGPAGLGPLPFAFIPPVGGGAVRVLNGERPPDKEAGDQEPLDNPPAVPFDVQRIVEFYSGSFSSDAAAQREWRTPPLWGVSDSAPYLHDGRAATLDEAIRLHGGEATQVVKNYKALSAADRKKLLAFLETL